MRSSQFPSTGKPLIGYVVAWQNVLNDVATKNIGGRAFHFNTYIISVLVIFYLQMKHKLPVVKDLASTINNKISFGSADDLGQFVRDFFHFYGKSFERNTHIISANVGRWQQMDSPTQTKFTPEQKRFVYYYSFN